jgi:photosystem II stability/assembly factor-like uncharacterized protein
VNELGFPRNMPALMKQFFYRLSFLKLFPMRLIALLLISAAAVAQSAPLSQQSNTTESLRGVSAVSRKIAWASGTHGTYLRTVDGGTTWIAAQVPDAIALDFRAVVAFDAEEAFLMSSGTGDQSRIYHTTDAGQHWQTQFTNTNPKGFFDSLVFWDRTHGIALGDPVPDESGQLKFELLLTDDGQNWHAIPPSQLPPAIEGEGAFAASNTCIAILPAPDGNIWFATGKAARVFHSPDHGKTWQVFETPLPHGPDTAGIFSIAFRDGRHGVIAGGDYKRPNDDGPNLAFTEDGGKSWALSKVHPLAFFGAAAYDRRVNATALREQAADAQAESGGKKKHFKAVPPQRIFLIGQDFIFDFRPPANPSRISPDKKSEIKFNAASSYPEGGALIVGPKGTIASIP